MPFHHFSPSIRTQFKSTYQHVKPKVPKFLQQQQSFNFQKQKYTMRNMSNINPGCRKRLLIGPGHLHHVPKCGDRNGALNPISPNGCSDRVSNLKSVHTSRQIAVLKIPPHRNPNVFGILFMASRRSIRRG